jgi:hypothetical protein
MFGGFDRDTHDALGDGVMGAIRGHTNLRWVGLYLSHGPLAPGTTWTSRRPRAPLVSTLRFLRSEGLGVAPIYVCLRIANHRIQMKAGDGCFTIAEGKVAPNNSHIVQVRIEDAEGHCERARQNGAIILTEPKDHPYGERQYNAEDFRPPLGLHRDYRRSRSGGMERRCVSSRVNRSWCGSRVFRPHY